MRNNLPVSDREFVFPYGKTIVSYANLQGKITKVNEGFIELSGYSMRELLGQPHNILRHPDMPPEVFSEMWHGLKKGHAWSGLIKNRRKNGDFYWVRANISPLVDGTGYVSVRVEASREDIAAAEALYARIRKNACVLPIDGLTPFEVKI